MNNNFPGGNQYPIPNEVASGMLFQSQSSVTQGDVYAILGNVLSQMNYPNADAVVNTAMSVIQPQLTEYINNANRTQAETEGYIKSLISQNQALILQQKSQIMENARLRSQKRTCVRRFSTDDTGCGICSETGKEDIRIGHIRIIRIIDIRIEKSSTYKDYKYITYIDSNVTERKAIIPLEKLATKKLLQFFLGFNYICSNSTIANEYLAYCINNFPAPESVIIPEFAGFTFMNENGVIKADFNCNNGKYDVEFLKECSEIFQKKIMPYGQLQHDDIALYANSYLDSSEKVLLFVYSICGLLSSVLDDIGYPMKKILIVSSPNEYTTRQACCYLQTYNKDKSAVPFDANITAIRKYMRNANDETVVFIDSCKADDDKRRSSVVTELMVLNDEADSRPHNTAVISDKVQYLVPKDKSICITLSNDLCGFMSVEDEQKMCYGLSMLMRYIIQDICSDYERFRCELKSNINYYIENSKNKDLLSSNEVSDYSVLAAICMRIQKYFNIDCNRLKVPDLLLSVFTRVSEISDNSSEVIVSDFMAVLNSKIVNDDIGILIHSKEMDFVSGESQVIIKDDLMLIEERTITEVILSEMKTTDSIIRLERALDEADLIHATKGLRFPCTVYNNGISSRKEFIAVKLHEIIDESMRIKIDIKACEKWFSKDAAGFDMMPLAVNHIGYNVYRKFDFEAQDNLHCFITGKSGSGKTFYMTEYIVTLHKTTNQLTVIFDTSKSFTKEAIIKNLSVGGDDRTKEDVRSYIDQNFEFCDVEENGIPVEILKLGYSASNNERKKIIQGIVSASIQNMGKKQRAELSGLINTIIENKDTSIVDLLEEVEYGEVSESLRMQLEEILYPFGEYRMNDTSWGEYLKGRNGVIIISSPDSDQSGSALVDMMLMSLFYYQRNNPDRHINVVIDEVQNQNCNKGSAIEKVLREGRKFHMSLTYATQSLSESNRDKLKTMNGAELKVYFKPDNQSAKSIARNIGVPVTELTSLNKGECYIEGTFYNNIEKENDFGLVRGFTYRNFVK